MLYRPVRACEGVAGAAHAQGLAVAPAVTADPDTGSATESEEHMRELDLAGAGLVAPPELVFESGAGTCPGWEKPDLVALGKQHEDLTVVR